MREVLVTGKGKSRRLLAIIQDDNEYYVGPVNEQATFDGKKAYIPDLNAAKKWTHTKYWHDLSSAINTFLELVDNKS